MKNKHLYTGSIAYLNLMGFLHLPNKEDIDFVAGEDTGKFTRHAAGCMSPTPTYNQVMIPGDTVYELSKKNKEGTTAV